MVTIKFYDNGGETIDQYTVVFDVFGKSFTYAMSAQPAHPQGSCFELLNAPPSAAQIRKFGRKLTGDKTVPDAVRKMAGELLGMELE